MGADYTPEMIGYTGQTPFKFWCQTVLPLVYDDSLSYYEVLAKMTIKINEIIEEMGTIPDEIVSQIREYMGSEEFKSELEKYIQEYEENKKRRLGNEEPKRFKYKKLMAE